MAEGRVVIRNGLVPHLGAGATVVLVGRHVAEVVQPGRKVEGRPDDWDVDADGRLVVPGQVDAHAHLALGALLRLCGLPGRAPATLAELRARVIRPAEERTTPERLEPLVRAGALAALRAGATCVLDGLGGPAGAAAELMEAEARALAAVGLRAAVSCRGRSGAEAAGGMRAAAEFAQRHALHPRLRGMVGLADLADLPEEALEAAREHAPGAGLQASAGEDDDELARARARWGQGPIALLAERGLLGPRTVVAHAGALAREEAALLSQAGATLALAPRAAAFWGAPLAPLLSAAGLDVPLALGTDGLFPDPAGEAAAAAMAMRQAERSARAAGGLLGRVAWPAAARLASILFGERVGVLAPGALADVVVLDWRPPVPLPDVSDGDLALLWAGAPAAWTIVDGVVRLREGRLLGGDEREIAASAREAAARLFGG